MRACVISSQSLTAISSPIRFRSDRTLSSRIMVSTYPELFDRHLRLHYTLGRLVRSFLERAGCRMDPHRVPGNKLLRGLRAEAYARIAPKLARKTLRAQ